MLKSLSFNRSALAVVTAVAGLGLFLAPWYLGYSASAYAAWNAWIVGAAIAAIAGAAYFAFHEAEYWANAVLGLWAAIAPWTLGFTGEPAALWSHLVAGLAVAILAGAGLWLDSGHGSDRPYSTA